MNLTETTLINRLNGCMPIANEVQLGQVLEDLIVNYNALQASYAGLVTKYELLLAHLDTANVAGIGNANAATYGVPVTAAAQINELSDR